MLIDSTTVSVIYDIEPDMDGTGLYFEFQLPVVLTREEVRGFSQWLAESGYGGTAH
jgi:hypothetical protein